MIPADSPDVLCPACSLTRTIPNLTQPNNRVYWYKLETAKRRLLFALSALGLNTDSRRTNPEAGLQFEFLEDGNMGAKVLTGGALDLPERPASVDPADYFPKA